MIRLETHKQLGSFTMPQFLPNNHNHSQVLPQTAGFRTPEEVYLLLEAFSPSSSRPSPKRLSELFQSVLWLMAGLLITFLNHIWQMDTGHLFGSMMAAQAFLSCKSAGGWGWLWTSSLFTLGNACGFCQIPPSSTHDIDIPLAPLGSLGHLNSISCVLFCLPTLSPLLCCA